MAGEPPTGRRLRFTPAQRLQKSWEFERVKLGGQRLVMGCLILNWKTAEAHQQFCRLGVVTSRKIGNAVVRSRARRLLREVFRRHQHEFAAPTDMVLVARQSIAEKDYSGVERDFVAAARRAKIVRENR